MSFEANWEKEFWSCIKLITAKCASVWISCELMIHKTSCHCMYVTKPPYITHRFFHVIKELFRSEALGIETDNVIYSVYTLVFYGVTQARDDFKHDTTSYCVMSNCCWFFCWCGAVICISICLPSSASTFSHFLHRWRQKEWLILWKTRKQ